MLGYTDHISVSVHHMPTHVSVLDFHLQNLLPLHFTSIVGKLFTHESVSNLADLGTDVMHNDKGYVVLKMRNTLP